MRGRNRTFRGHSVSPDYIRTSEFTVTAVLLFESRGIKEHDVPGWIKEKASPPQLEEN
jgi:hypothetical protein